MRSSIVFSAALVAVANALAFPTTDHPHPPGYPGHWGSSWDLKKFTSLVIFGDSYSDDSRLGYFINNNGTAPPVGWVDPVVSNAPMNQIHPGGKSNDDVYRTMHQQMAAVFGVNTSSSILVPTYIITLSLVLSAAMTLRHDTSALSTPRSRI